MLKNLQFYFYYLNHENNSKIIFKIPIANITFFFNRSVGSPALDIQV